MDKFIVTMEKAFSSVDWDRCRLGSRQTYISYIDINPKVVLT